MRPRSRRIAMRPCSRKACFAQKKGTPACREAWFLFFTTIPSSILSIRSPLSALPSPCSRAPQFLIFIFPPLSSLYHSRFPLRYYHELCLRPHTIVSDELRGGTLLFISFLPRFISHFNISVSHDCDFFATFLRQNCDKIISNFVRFGHISFFTP